MVRNVGLADIVIAIVPEICPSLKGNVSDLAPGPENDQIPLGRIGIVDQNAQLQWENITDPSGNPVEILEI